MKVTMSNTDYAELVAAAQWIEQHAGKDAPEYPKIDKLSRVVADIARRRQPDSSQPWRPPPVDETVVDLRKAIARRNSINHN